MPRLPDGGRAPWVGDHVIEARLHYQQSWSSPQFLSLTNHMNLLSFPTEETARPVKASDGVSSKETRAPLEGKSSILGEGKHLP